MDYVRSRLGRHFPVIRSILRSIYMTRLLELFGKESRIKTESAPVTVGTTLYHIEIENKKKILHGMISEEATPSIVLSNTNQTVLQSAQN